MTKRTNYKMKGVYIPQIETFTNQKINHWLDSNTKPCDIYACILFTGPQKLCGNACN